MSEEAFLQAMREQPDDIGLRMVFSDWLEERGDPRGELLRLSCILTQGSVDIPRRALERQMTSLLARGVAPVGPFWTNSIGMRFAWVAPGTFQMGSSPDEADRRENERPHQVTVGRGFFMGVHPVTQAQWRAVMDCEPSRFRGDDRPVECISWEDCQDFCKQLARKDALAAEFPSPYRLPTEIEWEYACRAGTTTPFAFGDSLSANQAAVHSNFPIVQGQGDASGPGTLPVGRFLANAWGLTDMHGNVFEWCADALAPYPGARTPEPLAKATESVRVLRGGSWHSLAARCRSACRGWALQGYRGSDVGCRVCFRTDYHYAI
ncbi:MAG: SUMF1/EgtB/PvdO family nonheme iron enzyme [Gemmataceae bacterium]|nr:SUMF1/EgtB/PvdO family nonheme iron enzyme [Gemmataceae bacterium]